MRVERNERRPELGDRAPVPDDEEEHEQHDGERQHGADRAEEGDAAKGRELLEQVLAALDQPGLHVAGADRQVLLQPVHDAADDRQLRQLLEAVPLLLPDPGLKPGREIRGLARERERERRHRTEEQEQDEHRQGECRDRGAAAEPLDHARLRRLQQEADEQRPGDRPEEGLDDPVHEEMR